MKADIQIDMDKKCKKCGAKGVLLRPGSEGSATANGLCPACITEKMSLGERLRDKALEEAKAQFAALLDDEWPGAWETRQKALSAWLGENPGEDPKGFVFKVSLAVEVRAVGCDLGMESKLAYGIRHTATTDTACVSVQPELGPGGARLD